MAPPIPENSLRQFYGRDLALDALVANLRQRDDPVMFREYTLDLTKPIADSVFEVAKPKRRSFVAKLTSRQAEMSLFHHMNNPDIPGVPDYIVEWETFGDVAFEGLGACHVVVMKKSTSVKALFAGKQAQDLFWAKVQCVQSVASALKFLHSQGYIHGNFTLDHVVFDNYRAKLLGFGNATQINREMELYCTPEYCPPEMATRLVDGDDYLQPLIASDTYDVWGMGVGILKLFSPLMQLKEFMNLTNEEILMAIAHPSFNLEASIAACGLNTSQKNHLRRLLDPNPATRGTLDDLDNLIPKNVTTPSHTSADVTVQMEKYKVPCLWGVEEKNGVGFISTVEKILLRTEFRLTFYCEMRGPDLKCEPFDDINCDKLVFKVNHEVVRKLIPVLRVTCGLFKILGLLAEAATNAVDVFSIPDSAYTNLTAAVHALETVEKNVQKLNVEDKLEKVVNVLEGDSNVSADMLEQAAKTTQATFDAFRNDDELYEKLLSLLSTIQYNWQEHRIVGGLVKKVYRSGINAGQLRWMCRAHAERDASLLYDGALPS
ncbi:serine/threonine protein kinase [Aphanomyces invadans]|uniref:Serine/threonine protein kinase n=1 Tax=Aphanomyces invadans TaxID=157072 RepID=A0A024TP53_9STRA|nr:serine/threonine protein kinase [Aphanomyces invadans]ETV95890.1 serine/threonine protein kinase [Aphanomyces invadans]|eukprot:XP_008875641.1 serine/threonine protein kinase [Aphanomyces invadans]